MPASKFSLQDQRHHFPIIYKNGPELVECMKKIPISKRQSYRGLAAQLKLSPTTAYRKIKEGPFHKHSSAVMPHHNEENKLGQLSWCFDHVNSATSLYSKMLEVIHIDEKSFDMTELTKPCYLADDEKIHHVSSFCCQTSLLLP